MTRRSGLGRGLDALIPGSGESQPSDGALRQISIQAIKPNPRQPRSKFDADELSSLAVSIKEHGVIQPLLLSEDETGGYYLLVAGERRLLAAKEAGLQTVPAIIIEVSDLERLEIALIENLQRADLSPLEMAKAYQQLVEEFNLSHDQIAERIGKSRTAVTNTLRLLKLPQSVKKALDDGTISEGHARAILSLPSSQAQSAVLQTIIKKRLNVRQTEELVRKLIGERPKKVLKKSKSSEIIALEEKLRNSLGTKVKLNHGKKGGTIVIHYYSEEELESLLEKLTYS
jgi:ParB family chromosome partitioning protein